MQLVPRKLEEERSSVFKRRRGILIEDLILEGRKICLRSNVSIAIDLVTSNPNVLEDSIRNKSENQQATTREFDEYSKRPKVEGDEDHFYYSAL